MWETIACVEVDDQVGLLAAEDARDAGQSLAIRACGSQPLNSSLAVSLSDMPEAGVYDEGGHGSTNSKAMIVWVTT